MYKTCKHSTINRQQVPHHAHDVMTPATQLTLLLQFVPHPPPPSAKHHKWTFLYSSNIYTRILQICSTIQIIAAFLIYRCWFFPINSKKSWSMRDAQCCRVPTAAMETHVHSILPCVPMPLMHSTWSCPQAAVLFPGSYVTSMATVLSAMLFSAGFSDSRFSLLE